MIAFLTPTALPIEAATTMGVSVKETDGAIGKFGTGLKYAIAGVLRLGGKFVIWIDAERYEFTAHAQNIRGRDFRIVHCNGVACGFTTELGKHWQPWQLFRELASNTLDEQGRWTHEVADPRDARTVIFVDCREVEDAEQQEQVFLGDRPTLVASSMGAAIHAGETRHYYFNGIRAGSFGGVAPVSVNVTRGSLSEDRMLDLAVVQTELGWAFRTAQTWDRDFLLTVLPQHEPGEFWIENVSAYSINEVLPKDMLAFLAERPKFIEHPAFKKSLEKHLRSSGLGVWAEIAMTPRYEALIAEGESLCKTAGVDVIPRSKVHFTADLPDRTLAVTNMDTRHVWFSTRLVLLGRDEFLCGYLEEALHAMTGARDCTREFQNQLLSMVVGLASRGVCS